MGTIIVAVGGVFVVLGMWMLVELLADQHLGERSPGCGCGLHTDADSGPSGGGYPECGRCTVQLSEHGAVSSEPQGEEQEERRG